MNKALKLSTLLLMSLLIIASCGKSNNNNDDDDNNNNDTTPQAQTYDIVKIATDSGDIYIWLYDQTPLHKANFDSLTRAGFYDGLTFHRIIDEFVIQGGDPDGDGTGGPGYRIPAEFVDSIQHIEGAVGAARNNNPLKESNGSQFYIVEKSSGTHFLDGDYTVFGQTIGGMDVVHKLAEVPTDGNDNPLTDVIMSQVEMVSFTADELLNQFNWVVPEV